MHRQHTTVQAVPRWASWENEYLTLGYHLTKANKASLWVWDKGRGLGRDGSDDDVGTLSNSSQMDEPSTLKLSGCLQDQGVTLRPRICPTPLRALNHHRSQMKLSGDLKEVSLMAFHQFSWCIGPRNQILCMGFGRLPYSMNPIPEIGIKARGSGSERNPVRQWLGSKDAEFETQH